jgi:uncharacterized repeat protein (TIGR01451 family)
MSLKPSCALARLAASALLALALPTLAAAQAPAEAPRRDPLEIVLTVHRITTDAAGKEVAAEAKSVTAGDLVEYRAVYTNKGEARIEGLVATLPIPVGLAYQPRSASPAGALAATGDGVFAAEPLMRKARDAGGQDKLEPVPYAEYRALRWQVDALEPGSSIAVAARAVVPAATPVTSKDEVQ